MVANKLKNLVSLTREAVRDARQVLEELVGNVGHGHRPAQPALVRIPIRNSKNAQNLRSPFNSNYRSSYRSFSTTVGARNPSTFTNLLKQQPASRFTYSKRVPKNFGAQFWPYSAFRRPLAGSGQFPNGLYRNFVGLNARNFSTYGGNFSHQAVQNLTTTLRCLMNNGGDLSSKLMKSKSHDGQHFLSYDGCASQKEAPQTFKLARCESTGIVRSGSYVEFTLPSLELSIPTMSFINDEILDTMESGFENIKAQIDRTNANIQEIFNSYGSLPLERRRESIRIHFPNLDALELEKFLVELDIHEGFVYTTDDVIGMIDEELEAMTETDSDFSLGEYIEEASAAPDLISTDSESTEGTAEDLYFLPVLSSGTGSEVIVNDHTRSVISMPSISV